MRKSKHCQISDEKRAIIIEMYAAGYAVKLIAAEFGVAKCTVTNTVKAAGAEQRKTGGKNKWSQEKRNEVFALIDSGLSVRLSAIEAGVPCATAQMWQTARKAEGKAKERAIRPHPVTHDKELIGRQRMIMDLFKPTSIAL